MEDDIQKIKKKYKLSKVENEIMIIIFSILKEKTTFMLMTILEHFSTKEEDLVIDAIESLIEKRLILPVNIPSNL